ncbi:M23 family metallopeptidase [uncultured Sphingomonas sp.]|uniref:M23 family metallopeptidase n=1 Tax=uncultured Sphingomonas sp. TaxID=158754 RepID=UPI00258A4EB9|nr:M23 family metallopeptidase [uncultured Sphingomonas sp.]
MTRLGWSILALILLAAAGFASLLSFGRAPVTAPEPVASEPAAAVPASGDARLIVPVAGIARDHLADSWGQERGGGKRAHHAIDIMAPVGTPVRAAAAGRIEKLFDSRDGGLTVYQRSADGRTVYYYAHLAGYRRDLAEGQAVRAGEPIAAVGATGNADPGAPHLHFSIKRMQPGEHWWEGQEVNPYPLLAGSRGLR